MVKNEEIRVTYIKGLIAIKWQQWAKKDILEYLIDVIKDNFPGTEPKVIKNFPKYLDCAIFIPENIYTKEEFEKIEAKRWDLGEFVVFHIPIFGYKNQEELKFFESKALTA